MDDVFTGSFTQQEPLPPAAIAAAVAVMQSGRLHRYNVVEGEAGETALLEQEFAAYVGRPYCLAVASGGYALGCALRALNVLAGEKVLTNAFTLAPVPGAISAIGAVPVFVESTENLTIDLDHLDRQITDTGARVLMLSHMRGHQPDMARLMAITDRHAVQVIEDCAHTMGGGWGGQPSGIHGVISCYSTQTYKHINSGEGGLLVCDDPDIAARSVLLSGSYMLFERHLAAPQVAEFAPHVGMTPNVSGRMDNLRAAVLRPQLATLDAQVERWAALHDTVEAILAGTPGLALIERDPQAVKVGSSFQFRLPELSGARVESFVQSCALRGVALKWFGAPQATGYTSRYDHWAYANSPVLHQTDKVLAGLIDMRLPLTFSTDDCALIARIIRSEILRIFANAA